MSESHTTGDEHLWTISEAAHFLGLAPGSLYHLISQHRIPVVRISSRCVRFNRRALLEWIKHLTQEAEEFPNVGSKSPAVSQRKQI
jgi:excisionase family DNA binding protein